MWAHLVSSRLSAASEPTPWLRLAHFTAGHASSMTSGISNLGVLYVTPTVIMCTSLCTSISSPLLLICSSEKEKSNIVSHPLYVSSSAPGLGKVSTSSWCAAKTQRDASFPTQAAPATAKALTRISPSSPTSPTSPTPLPQHACDQVLPYREVPVITIKITKACTA